MNPLPGQVVTDTSFVRNYKNYTTLSIPIELFYWSEKSGREVPQATIFDTY